MLIELWGALFWMFVMVLGVSVLVHIFSVAPGDREHKRRVDREAAERARRLDAERRAFIRDRDKS